MNFLTTTLPLRTYLFTFALFITVIIYVQNNFSVGSYSTQLSFLMKQIVKAIKFDQAGSGGEETRSGTEKRCSHILKSGHPAWWSADNCSILVGTLSRVIKVYQECI